MTSEQAQETLDQLAGIRRRIDELRDQWEVNHDVAAVMRSLDDCRLTRQRIRRSRRCSLAPPG